MGDQIMTALDQIYRRKVAFFATFFVVLLISYGFLFAIDFIPEAPEPEDVAPITVVSTDADDEDGSEGEIEFETPVDPLPVRIIIDELDKDFPVLNPESRAVADLDNALLKGVVRHPDSADLSDDGNVFLFGHSSYLPNVMNKNFQAFNGIQDLVWGDTIRVQSADTEYVYRVKRVYKTLASQATIELDNSSAKLTLVTCNSFGSKDDRFVVEADLIDTRTI